MFRSSGWTMFCPITVFPDSRSAGRACSDAFQLKRWWFWRSPSASTGRSGRPSRRRSSSRRPPPVCPSEGFLSAVTTRQSPVTSGSAPTSRPYAEPSTRGCAKPWSSARHRVGAGRRNASCRATSIRAAICLGGASANFRDSFPSPRAKPEAMPFQQRRQTPTVRVGGVPVGSEHPVVVQSMTNTDTADAAGTAVQARALAEAGSELVRITVNTDAAAAAVPEIVERLADAGCPVPIIGDFHYNGHLLLTKFPATAAALAKYRINPGNVGGKRRDEHFRTIIRVAVEHGK